MNDRFERFKHLFDVFETAGKELYFVGGCVRDAIMGVDEQGDYDFTTNARPEEIEAILEKGGFHTFALGARFGTIATVVDGTNIEITTFRVAETYAEGSRHPEVLFGDTLEDDLSRRDLSINAMAEDRHGKVYDLYGGRDAIASGTLEVPQGGFENTLSILGDDPLRLLRIARFAARFDFLPTPDTTAAATQRAQDLKHISHERWKAEMDKLLAAPFPLQGLSWLRETGALYVILPELRPLANEQLWAAFTHEVNVLGAGTAQGWALLGLHAAGLLTPDRELAALDRKETAEPVVAEDIGRSIAGRFKFSNAERKALLLSLNFSLECLSAPMPLPHLRRWYTSHGDLCFQQLNIAKAALDAWEVPHQCDQLRMDLEHLLERENPVPVLPSGLGKHLAREFELPRGPEIGEAVNAVKNALFDGELENPPTLEQCLSWFAHRHTEETDSADG